ncbi:unnamed protein product [Lactuca virosa]|uniref:Uncharacterized protein n=1 Tax=Lactuca virosa TaxID=75947 RepID=A0AAU9P7I0_9ASTR|nr:unnamed protein product [Lactuca virosa]
MWLFFCLTDLPLKSIASHSLDIISFDLMKTRRIKSFGETTLGMRSRRIGTSYYQPNQGNVNQGKGKGTIEN